MAAAYTVTLYNTAATAAAGIAAAASGKVTAVVPYKEDGKQRFMVVIAA